MNIYKSAELESTFIEIINHKKSNIIVGCIYRHPAMDLNEFNDYYLNELLHKLSSENKSVILLGEFNFDLMKMTIIIRQMNLSTLYLHICFFLMFHNQLELEILVKH